MNRPFFQTFRGKPLNLFDPLYLGFPGEMETGVRGFLAAIDQYLAQVSEPVWVNSFGPGLPKHDPRFFSLEFLEPHFGGAIAGVIIRSELTAPVALIENNHGNLTVFEWLATKNIPFGVQGCSIAEFHRSRYTWHGQYLSPSLRKARVPSEREATLKLLDEGQRALIELKAPLVEGWIPSVLQAADNFRSRTEFEEWKKSRVEPSFLRALDETDSKIETSLKVAAMRPILDGLFAGISEYLFVKEQAELSRYLETALTRGQIPESVGDLIQTQGLWVLPYWAFSGLTPKMTGYYWDEGQGPIPTEDVMEKVENLINSEAAYDFFEGLSDWVQA